MEEARRAITLRQVAALAGTSKSTVSRVLTGHPRISDATRNRVLGLIERHGYQPNQLARSLAWGRTGNLGVISTNSGSGFLRMCCAVWIWLRRNSAYACYVPLRIRPSRAGPNCALSGGGGQVDGLLLIAPGLDLFAQPFASDVPVVLCAARPARAARGWNHLDSVILDNDEAMRGLVQHLVAQGFRRLVHLAGPPDNHDARARARAFRAVVNRTPPLRGVVIPVGHVREDGLRAAQCLSEAALLDERCAFVAFNDSVAWGFVEGCRLRRKGQRWPVAITGWDDSPAGGETGLTSVAIPTYELGRAAAELLLLRLSPKTPSTPACHLQMKQQIRLRQSSLSRPERGPL